VGYMMQVQNKRSRFQLPLLLIHTIIFSLLSGCAGTGSFRWPEANPFQATALPASLGAEIPNAKSVRIAFTSNVMGEVEACGCAVGPKGGLDRRLNFIDMKLKPEASSWPYLILDAGNSVLATSSLDAARRDSYMKVAKELLKAHKSMGVQVQNVAYLDLGFGLKFFQEAAKEAELPLISATWMDASGKLVFEPSIMLDAGGEKVLVIGVSGGLDQNSDGLQSKDPVQAIADAVAAHPKYDGPVVVLSDLGLIRDEEVAKHRSLSGLPLVFVGSRDLGGLALPKQGKHSLHVQSEFRGQQWGLLDLKYVPGGNRWVNLEKMSELTAKWDSLIERRKRARDQLKQSRDWKLEDARLASTAKDLVEYAPGKPGTNSFYNYELINLDTRYQKRNRLTSKMNYLIDVKK